LLKLLYQLADRNDCVSQAILGNTLVGLIPSQNPDGRANNVRTNAHAFDMNRDWFARTQPEVVRTFRPRRASSSGPATRSRNDPGMSARSS